jgi:hypothetical protein
MTLKTQKKQILVMLILLIFVPIQVFAASLLANWSIPWTNSYFKLISVHNGSIGPLYYGPHLNAHIYYKSSVGKEIDKINWHIGKPVDRNCFVIYDSVSKTYLVDACKTGQKFKNGVEEALNSIKYQLNRLFSSNFAQSIVVVAILVLIVAVILAFPPFIVVFA